MERSPIKRSTDFKRNQGSDHITAVQVVTAVQRNGEKECRKRDEEFDNNIKTKKELLSKWNEGWECLFSAINPLTEKDLEKEVYIRNMGYSISEAINIQLAHYPYHIGQIVFIGKIIQNENWESLSIPIRAQQVRYHDNKLERVQFPCFYRYCNQKIQENQKLKMNSLMPIKCLCT